MDSDGDRFQGRRVVRNGCPVASKVDGKFSVPPMFE